MLETLNEPKPAPQAAPAGRLVTCCCRGGWRDLEANEVEADEDLEEEAHIGRVDAEDEGLAEKKDDAADEADDEGIAVMEGGGKAEPREDNAMGMCSRLPRADNGKSSSDSSLSASASEIRLADWEVRTP
jgi:hypothetical protein